MGPATPLPPDRPSGAAPERIEDAAQEFLTDWLVRRQYDQAPEFCRLKFTSFQPERRCEGTGARAAGARQKCWLMEYATKRLGPAPT
jgi:hypothetical protein